MRRTLGGFVIVALFAAVVATGRADETVRPPAAAPLPKIPGLPPVAESEPNWKKAEPITVSDPADGPRELPDIPKKPPAPIAVGKKTDPADGGKAADPPPDPKKLKEELESLLRERELLTKPGDAPADERTKLRAQMDDLLKKLGEKKKAPPKPKADDHKPPSKFELPADGKVPDPVRAAANLYKDGDVDAALRVLGQIKDVNVLPTEDRVYTKYLTACCLRRTGKVSDAAAAFRDIANAKEDAFLTECALWQLAAIRSTQELETQLEQLRSRRNPR